MAVISFLVAVLFVVAAFHGTWRLPVTGVAVTVICRAHLGGAYPALIEQFACAPANAPSNPPTSSATLTRPWLFGLDDVDYQTNYDAKPPASAGQFA